MTEPVYNIPGLAKRLDIGISSTYKLIRNKEVVSARAGKLIRVTESAVMEFLRRGAGGTQSGTGEKQAA